MPYNLFEKPTIEYFVKVRIVFNSGAVMRVYIPFFGKDAAQRFANDLRNLNKDTDRLTEILIELNHANDKDTFNELDSTRSNSTINLHRGVKSTEVIPCYRETLIRDF